MSHAPLRGRMFHNPVCQVRKPVSDIPRLRQLVGQRVSSGTAFWFRFLSPCGQAKRRSGSPNSFSARVPEAQGSRVCARPSGFGRSKSRVERRRLARRRRGRGKVAPFEVSGHVGNGILPRFSGHVLITDFNNTRGVQTGSEPRRSICGFVTFQRFEMRCFSTSRIRHP